MVLCLQRKKRLEVFMSKKTKILKFIESVGLTRQGKQLVKKLLMLKRLALNNNNIKLLTKVNKQLFTINELYRKHLTNKAIKHDLGYDHAKTFDFITCYRLV